MPNPHIVYDDDAVRAVWLDGATDYVLITFGDLSWPADGVRFFADVPAIRHGITCLGLMAKSQNWYPAAHVAAAVDAVRALLAPYAVRILYGGSMGGYAAIKFSALFEATRVLALCPQWSIDPAECDGVAPGYAHHFRPDMAGMGIRPGDTRGRIVVFSDPRHDLDSFHRDRIVATGGDVVCIDVHSADHHVTPVMSGSRNLLDLIDACRFGGAADLLRLTNRFRRQSRFRREVLLHRALEKHPRAVLRILLALRHDTDALAELHGRVGFPLIAVLLRRNEGAAVRSYLDAVRETIRTSEDALRIDMIAHRLDQAAPALWTQRGTVLAYDPIDGKVIQIGPARLRAEAAFVTIVRLAADGARAVLYVLFRGGQFHLEPDERGDLRVAEAPAACDIVRGGETVSLRFGGRFLAVAQDGRVVVDREHADDAACFTLRPIG